MRWTAILMVLAVIPLVQAAEPWGCCIPPAGVCFDGSSFTTEQAFTDACNSAGGTVEDPGLATSCSSYAECTEGCCCAGPEIFDSPSINSDEDLLRITQFACEQKEEGYYFETLTPGSTCVSICGGTPGTEENETFAVSGTAVNASSTVGLSNATVFIPYQGGQVSTQTATDGTFTLEDVPSMTGSIYAIHQACLPGQTEPLSINGDITGVTIALQCEDVTCTHDSPSFLSYPSSVRGTDEIEFTFNLTDSCGDFIQYEPMRCDSQFENCVSLPPSASPAITDEGLSPQTTYCYKADARFSDGSTTSTEEESDACITTGEPECMDGEAEGEWCGIHEGGSAILSCDENNLLVAESCGTLMCSERGGSPECVPMPPCDMCNGLVGLFASIGFEVSPEGVTMDLCENVCLLDTWLNDNPHVVDTYQACVAVDSCENYRSKESCETDFCGLSGCNWTVVNEELGQGICSGVEGPACSQCEELFGGCNEQMCQSLGPNCYYDGEENGLTFTLGCLDKEDMACRYYDEQAECGETSAIFDIEYDNEGKRIGYTNELLEASDDLMGIGACSWSGSFCMKDADMMNEGEDDCIENQRIFTDPECLVDSEPPTTEFFLGEPPIVSRLGIRSLPMYVTDNHTPVDDIETYVCFHPTGDCYPVHTLSTIPLPEAGQYIMNYFSKDASENSEVVQGMTIIVEDSGIPGIEEVRIEEDI